MENKNTYLGTIMVLLVYCTFSCESKKVNNTETKAPLVLEKSFETNSNSCKEYLPAWFLENWAKEKYDVDTINQTNYYLKRHEKFQYHLGDFDGDRNMDIIIFENTFLMFFTKNGLVMKINNISTAGNNSDSAMMEEFLKLEHGIWYVDDCNTLNRDWLAPDSLSLAKGDLLTYFKDGSGTVWFYYSNNSFKCVYSD